MQCLDPVPNAKYDLKTAKLSQNMVLMAFYYDICGVPCFCSLTQETNGQYGKWNRNVILKKMYFPYFFSLNGSKIC